MSLSWDNQSDRIRAVFGLGSDQPLPEVDVDNLLTYRAHVRAMLGKGGFEAEYHSDGGMHSSRVWVCGIKYEIDPVLGVLCNVFGEHLEGGFPLSHVDVSDDVTVREIIEDYKHWLQTCRQQ